LSRLLIVSGASSTDEHPREVPCLDLRLRDGGDESRDRARRDARFDKSKAAKKLGLTRAVAWVDAEVWAGLGRVGLPYPLGDERLDALVGPTRDGAP
jgi:hypothetical protein